MSVLDVHGGLHKKKRSVKYIKKGLNRKKRNIFFVRGSSCVPILSWHSIDLKSQLQKTRLKDNLHHKRSDDKCALLALLNKTQLYFVQVTIHLRVALLPPSIAIPISISHHFFSPTYPLVSELADCLCQQF